MSGTVTTIVMQTIWPIRLSNRDSGVSGSGRCTRRRAVGPAAVGPMYPGEMTSVGSSRSADHSGAMTTVSSGRTTMTRPDQAIGTPDDSGPAVRPTI